MSAKGKKKRLMTDFFGGGGNKKSKTDSSSKSPLFIVCPGAGGVLPKDGTLEAQLGSLGRVAVIPKSTGYSGMKGCVSGSKGSLNGNLRILTDFIAREVSDEEDKELVLVGQSFGCRAIVHWLSGNHEVRKHPSIPVPWSTEAIPDNYRQLRSKVRNVFFFGYPLAHASQDRSAALKGLPYDVRACFVIGTSDKMALGEKLSKKSLEATTGKMTASTELIWVEKGGHSPPNEKKWATMDLNKSIKTFLSAGADDDADG